MPTDDARALAPDAGTPAPAAGPAAAAAAAAPAPAADAADEGAADEGAPNGAEDGAVSCGDGGKDTSTAAPPLLPLDGTELRIKPVGTGRPEDALPPLTARRFSGGSLGGGCSRGGCSSSPPPNPEPSRLTAPPAPLATRRIIANGPVALGFVPPHVPQVVSSDVVAPSSRGAEGAQSPSHPPTSTSTAAAAASRASRTARGGALAAATTR